MGGLLETLTQDVEAQKATILAAAEAQRREILLQAQATVEELRQTRFNECHERLELEETRLLGNSRLQARNTILQAKHEILDEAFEKAFAVLADLRNRPEYGEIFQRLAGKALEEFEGGDQDGVKVFVDERDLELCRDFFEGRRISCKIDTSRSFLGGLEMSSADGRFNISNTLEGRLAKMRHGLNGQLAQILFDR